MVFALSGALFASCSEDSDLDIIGEGDVRIGMGVKLKNSGVAGARILNAGLVVQSGFIQIKKIELETEGVDENGNKFEKEFELKFKEIKKIDFNRFDSEVDFFINIPSGNYEEIEFKIDLIDNRKEPSIQLDGTYTYQDGRTVPMRFQVFGDDDDDFDFEVELEADDDDLFFLNGVNNPLALFQIDAKGWFTKVGSFELETADLTDGVLLINKDKNKSIYRKVETRIKDSTDIELKLN
ncbi:hypothetical protein SAMN03080617_00761 [Algoriphagus alkaliphilus]|uniref:DUF4382 domain-containing protein n=2 Tax=Algoriphagus alkaliphilus TaxID=279824 RepID=A0A1G5VYT7_9BACT|nr:hypothetical protein [Cyclobacterium sp.]SDA50898.1 hypothetical protein SAMN03080617_00761 [Algoriphagus alkaliphilus]